MNCFADVRFFNEKHIDLQIFSLFNDFKQNVFVKLHIIMNHTVSKTYGSISCLVTGVIYQTDFVQEKYRIFVSL